MNTRSGPYTSRTGIVYTLVRSGRRTLAIEVRSAGEVIVRAPFFMPAFAIERFLEARAPWIRDAQRKYAENPPVAELSKEEIEALRKKAKAFIPGRVDYYSRIMGVRPTAVRFTPAKTRWGSCSPKNSVSFSVRLMAKPPEAIDYVVVHELAHILEHNHSKRFWAIVARYLPDYRERRKLLSGTR